MNFIIYKSDTNYIRESLTYIKYSKMSKIIDFRNLTKQMFMDIIDFRSHSSKPINSI